MTENYDVFISHKNEQLSWALRLQETLEDFGLSVFVDHAPHSGLQAEQNWRTQLHKHCIESTYMIVLWSKLITNDSFVYEEITWRLQECARNPSRRIILLPLDELKEAPLNKELKDHYGELQAFPEFVTLYRSLPASDADSSAHQVEDFSWYSATRRFIEQALPDASKRVIEIPYVVAAMTRNQAEDLLSGRHLRVPKDVFNSMMDIAESTGSFDVTRYGSTPEEWQPLPIIQEHRWSAHTIREILNLYQKQRRKYLKYTPSLQHEGSEYALNRLFWPYTHEIAGTDQQRQDAIHRLNRHPCLAFIDPLSLMHEEVYSVYEAVLGGLEKIFTIVLSPFIPVLHQDFNDYLAQESALLKALGLRTSYDRFYTFFEDAMKVSVMNVDHGYQLTRWVQFATDNITRYVSTTRPDPRWGGNLNLRQGPSLPPTL